MVEVRRRDKETIGALLRRFTRRVQQSGVLINARKQRFYKSPSTKREIHEKALRRVEMLKERRKLEKLGKLGKEEK